MTRTQVLALLTGSTAALTLSAALATRVDGEELDNRYVKALGAVDDFLAAWSHRDPHGTAFVTPQAQKKYDVHGFLVGTSSPQNAAFEILSGKAISSTHYRFTVKLYYYITGGGLKIPSAQSIDVKSSNDVDWKVDSLPSLNHW